MSTTQKSQSNKYEAAVGRATGKVGDPAQADSQEVVHMPKEAMAMIVEPTDDQIRAMMADPTMEFAPQVYSIEEGKMVSGVLEGHGPSTTFTQVDPVTKQETTTRVVDTWIIRHPESGFRISILSSVQLDNKLPPFVDGFVSIYRGKDKKTAKNFRVADYTVSGPKRPDGTLRSWVRKSVINVEVNAIDAPTSAPQLTAGLASAPGGEDVAA